MITKESQIRGAFLGLAYGDILGCPTESLSMQEIHDLFGEYTQLPLSYDPSILEAFPRLRPPGEHSDDTQQAMLLTLACLHPGGYTSSRFAHYLTHAYEKKACRGYGNRFEQAVKNLLNGTSFQKSGSFSAGIGAAMRVLPAALLYADQPAQLKQVITEQSAITHADVRAIAIAYALGYTVAKVLSGMSRENIIETLPGEVFDFEEYVVTKYASWNIEKSAVHEVSMALSYVLSKSIDDTPYIRERILDLSGTASVNDPYALAGGIHALVMGLQKDIDPHAQLLSICQLGSDTDTVAAMAGAILGARFGDTWIPTSLFLHEKRILAYAQSLLSKKPCESIDEWVEYEK